MQVLDLRALDWIRRDVAHALNLYINITDDDGVSCVEDDTHYLQVKAG